MCEKVDIKKFFNIENFNLINFVNVDAIEKDMIRSWRNGPNVRKCMHANHIISDEEHTLFLDKIKNDDKNLYWIVKEKQNYLGVIYFNKINYENKNAYLGLYKNNENTTKGIGKILLNLILKIAFDILELHTLKLEVFETNEKAINLYKSFGFLEEGRLKEFVYRDDKWQDVVIMGMTKEYYENQK